MTNIGKSDLTSHPILQANPLATFEELRGVIQTAINRVLESGSYILGQEVRTFESEFARFIGCSHCVAVNSGTDALVMALKALGIGEGDEVITVSHTAVATVEAIQLCGAVPVLVDVDRESYCMDPHLLETVLSVNTKAILPVHLYGHPADMPPILELAKKHGLYVIEDCAQAVGAFYKGRPVGSFGDAAAFSFCQDKILTTGGEGGMVVTNKKEIWSKVWSYKDHGKSYDAVYKSDIKPGPSFRWLHESFGTNWRMMEVQSAIGRIQLQKLEGWIRKRRRNAEILTNAFLNIPALRVTVPPDNVVHSYYKYYVFLRPEMLKKGWDRERIITAINNLGIPCFTGSCSEMYREKAFAKDNLRPGKPLPVAKELGDTAIMFPVHPTLSVSDMRDMVKAAQKIIGTASK